jgi:cytoskeleton protein RodZ
MASHEPQRDDLEPSETARRRLHLREVRSDHTGYDGIGVEMRAARIRVGAELSDIAQKLRISQAYLEAIEEGRFDELPGHVYVFGFLKTYARFLDLDEEIVVERFKTETTGPQRETRLAFPSAMDRGRLPTGRLLLGGLVIAVVAYAGWFVFTSDERSTADRVAPIPERLVPAVATEGTAATSSVAVAPTPVAVPPSEPAGDSAPSAVLAPPLEAESVADAVAVEPSDIVPVAPVVPATDVDVVVVADSPTSETVATEIESLASDAPLVSVVDETPVPSTAVNVAIETTPAPVAVVTELESRAVIEADVDVARTDDVVPRPASTPNAAEIRQLTDASTAPIAVGEPDVQISATGEGSTPGTEEVAAPAVAEASDGSVEVAVRSEENTPPPLAATDDSSTASSAGGYVPRVFGAGNEDARIVLVAEAESWVQVRATSGELLLTRVLRPGDRYLVPDRPGLVMMTGNLGALQVIVDGEVAPGLGPLGVIGRDIPLDADRLLAGRVSADFDAE